MFAQKQPDQLRKRLQVLQREKKLRNVDNSVFLEKAGEIVVAMKKMGETVGCDYLHV